MSNNKMQGEAEQMYGRRDASERGNAGSWEKA
jgi:hypothetical protein